MKTEIKIAILKDELLRFKKTKSICDECIPQELIDSHEEIIEDLEILEILRKHLYVAPELVELKMTGQEYANIHKVKYHNGIPIVADLETFNKINKWFNKRGGRK